MATRAFTREWLEKNEIHADGSDLVVHREFTEGRRWSSVYDVTFRHEGNFWRVSCQVPAAAEMDQGGVDTWFDETEVEATQVEPVMTPAITWKAVDEDVPQHSSARALNAAIRAVSGENAMLRDDNALLRKQMDSLHEAINQDARIAFDRREELRQAKKVKPHSLAEAVEIAISRLGPDVDTRLNDVGGCEALARHLAEALGVTKES